MTWSFLAMFWVQRCHRLAGQHRQTANTFVAPWRAAIDGRFTCSDGCGVGRAIRVTASGALGLRQQGVDAFSPTHRVTLCLYPIVSAVSLQCVCRFYLRVGVFLTAVAGRVLAAASAVAAGLRLTGDATAATWIELGEATELTWLAVLLCVKINDFTAG